MTDNREERHVELLAIDRSPAMRRLVRVLDEVYAPKTPPRAAELDAAVHQLLHRSGRPSHPSRWSHLRPPRFGTRVRLISVVGAVAVAVAALVARQTEQGPIPVSAQTLLSRAASAGLEPDRVAHFSYALTSTDGYAGSENVWIAANSRRGVDRLALTVRMRKDGAPAPNLDMRLLQTRSTLQIYTPADGTVSIRPGQPGNAAWLTVANGAFLAQKLERKAASASRGLAGLLRKVRVVPERTLQGDRVYVLRLNQTQTFYFDAHSYILRGADWSQRGRPWRARLVQYRAMPRSQVPPDTFRLQAPAGARIHKGSP